MKHGGQGQRRLIVLKAAAMACIRGAVLALLSGWQISGGQWLQSGGSNRRCVIRI